MTNIGILESLRLVREHPGVGLFAGIVGLVPSLGGYELAHSGLVPTITDWRNPLLYVLACCMTFSLRTVWVWGQGNWRDSIKSTAFVGSVEGLMVFCPIAWLALLALFCLVGINATATACILLSLDKLPAKTVTDVARELSLPRAKAAEVLDQRRLAARKPRPA